MKNHNYENVTKVRKFYKKGWLDESADYVWAGENALYFGATPEFPEGLYEGLGIESTTEAAMREEMRVRYNEHFRRVISSLHSSGGNYESIQVKFIEEGQDAVNKIRWAVNTHKRLFN